jgi:proteasomal ATPase-associated factor 1
MNPAALSLPVVSVQNTFPQVVQEVEEGLVPDEKFWVSCYKNSEPSVHAKVNTELDHLDRSLVHFKPIEGDVEVSRDAAGVSTTSIFLVSESLCVDRTTQLPANL